MSFELNFTSTYDDPEEYCEMVGAHEWVDVGGGMLICAVCQEMDEDHGQEAKRFDNGDFYGFPI